MDRPKSGHVSFCHWQQIITLVSELGEKNDLDASAVDDVSPPHSNSTHSYPSASKKWHLYVGLKHFS